MSNHPLGVDVGPSRSTGSTLLAAGDPDDEEEYHSAAEDTECPVRGDHQVDLEQVKEKQVHEEISSVEPEGGVAKENRVEQDGLRGGVAKENRVEQDEGVEQRGGVAKEERVEQDEGVAKENRVEQDEGMEQRGGVAKENRVEQDEGVEQRGGMAKENRVEQDEGVEQRGGVAKENRVEQDEGMEQEGRGGVAVMELSEEQVKDLKERAAAAKNQGNELFKNGDYSSAMEYYSEALELYPKSCDLADGSCDHERAVCFANRAACHMKKESHQEVIDDCTEALTLEPDYLKSLLRRAQAFEILEKYEDALEDYKKVIELDPTQVGARQALVYLPDKIKVQQENLKAEMLGKLKELGNAILNPFGLSTDNFQMQQDPNSGGYSINFKR